MTEKQIEEMASRLANKIKEEYEKEQKWVDLLDEITERLT